MHINIRKFERWYYSVSNNFSSIYCLTFSKFHRSVGLVAGNSMAGVWLIMPCTLWGRTAWVARFFYPLELDSRTSAWRSQCNILGIQFSQAINCTTDNRATYFTPDGIDILDDFYKLVKLCRSALFRLYLSLRFPLTLCPSYAERSTCTGSMLLVICSDHVPTS